MVAVRPVSKWSTAGPAATGRRRAGARNNHWFRLRPLHWQRAAPTACLGRGFRRVVHVQILERWTWRGRRSVRPRATPCAWTGHDRLVGQRQTNAIRHGAGVHTGPVSWSVADWDTVGARRRGAVWLDGRFARSRHSARSREVAGAHEFAHGAGGPLPGAAGVRNWHSP